MKQAKVCFGQLVVLQKKIWLCQSFFLTKPSMKNRRKAVVQRFLKGRSKKGLPETGVMWLSLKNYFHNNFNCFYLSLEFVLQAISPVWLVFLKKPWKQPAGFCFGALACGKPQVKEKQHPQKKDLALPVFFLTQLSLKNRRRRCFSADDVSPR